MNARGKAAFSCTRQPLRLSDMLLYGGAALLFPVVAGEPRRCALLPRRRFGASSPSNRWPACSCQRLLHAGNGLTSRQSQRRDLSRLVLMAVLAISNGATVHESRQLPSWLIFDVSQFLHDNDTTPPIHVNVFRRDNCERASHSGFA